MSQQVVTGQTDWSIRLWCYDAAGAAVTGLLHNSAGMSVSVVVRSKGRIISTTPLTLVARSGVGVHTDSAWTEVADGEYVVDSPDSYLATAGRNISLTVAATAITGTVIVETIEVGRPAELNTGSLLAALGLAAGDLDAQLADILAASGGGGGGGALTAEQNALLVSIAQWAARNNGGPMHYTGNVGDGGVLELTVGDDHETVMENDLPIVVKDPGGLFRAKLVASGSTLSWSAGQDGVGGLITGTVSTPTYDSGTELTTIVVQVPNCAAAGNITTPYKWQLKRTSGGKIKTELQGTLRLNADMS